MTRDNQIYVRFKGQTLGPFTREHLQKLATRGQLSRMHELSADQVSWSKAESFGIQFRSRTTAEPSQRHSHRDVTPTARASFSPQSVPESSQSDSKEWHIHVSGVTLGPVTQRELYKLLGEGRIGDDALLWKAGFENWIPVNEAIGTQSTKADAKSKSAVPGNDFHIKPNNTRRSPRSAKRGLTKSFHCWTFFIGLIFFSFMCAVFSEHTKVDRRHPQKLLADTGMAIAMFGFFGFTGYGVYIGYGMASRCPQCNSWWAAVTERIDEKGSQLGYDTVTEIDRHKNRSGDLIGTTERLAQVRVEEVFTTEHYVCRFCSHCWNQDVVHRHRL